MSTSHAIGWTNETNTKVITDLGVGLQLAVVRTTSMGTNEPSVLVLDGIVSRYFGVDDLPKVRICPCG
jgi:hypothetical protein